MEVTLRVAYRICVHSRGHGLRSLLNKPSLPRRGLLAEHVSTPDWGGLAGWKLGVLLGAETGPTGVLGGVGNRGLRQE